MSLQVFWVFHKWFSSCSKSRDRKDPHDFWALLLQIKLGAFPPQCQCGVHTTSKIAQKLPFCTCGYGRSLRAKSPPIGNWSVSWIYSDQEPAWDFHKKKYLESKWLDSSCKWWADALGSAAAVEEGFEGHNGVHASPPLVECTMMKGWGGARGRRGGWKMSPVTIHVSRVRGSDPHNLVFLPKLPIGAAVTPGMTCHGELGCELQRWKIWRKSLHSSRGNSILEKSTTTNFNDFFEFFQTGVDPLPYFGNNLALFPEK